MPEIDQSRAFVPVNISILTVSDTRTFKDDRSGSILKERIENYGHKVVYRTIVKDEIETIKTTVREMDKRSCSRRGNFYWMNGFDWP